MRRSDFSHQFVEFIPERLEAGVLYVSNRYQTAVHRCACGCGEEVVTPLGPADWTLEIEHGRATLNPSIGNWSFPCGSHYFITGGRVVWARQLSRGLIELGREHDRKARERHIESVNYEKSRRSRRLLLEAWTRFKRWLMS